MWAARASTCPCTASPRSLQSISRSITQAAGPRRKSFPSTPHDRGRPYHQRHGTATHSSASSSCSTSHRDIPLPCSTLSSFPCPSSSRSFSSGPKPPHPHDQFSRINLPSRQMTRRAIESAQSITELYESLPINRGRKPTARESYLGILKFSEILIHLSLPTLSINQTNSDPALKSNTSLSMFRFALETTGEGGEPPTPISGTAGVDDKVNAEASGNTIQISEHDDNLAGLIGNVSKINATHGFKRPSSVSSHPIGSMGSENEGVVDVEQIGQWLRVILSVIIQGEHKPLTTCILHIIAHVCVIHKLHLIYTTRARSYTTVNNPKYRYVTL